MTRIKFNWQAIVTVLIFILCTACRGEDSVKTPLEKGISTKLQTWSTNPNASGPPLFPLKIESDLQTFLEKTIRLWKLPGAVLAIASSQKTWMTATGQANVADQVALLPTDRFRIGRMSEPFMAVVCLQLVEEGILDLDDPITDWLPAEVYQQIPKSDRITIQELLNHTSGLPELNTEAFQQTVIADPNHRWQAKELLSFGFASNQIPTQRNFFYSTANYLLLELILGRATGDSLSQTLQERIFKPLGLKNTFVELTTQQPIVRGYQDWNRDGSLEDVTQPLINTGLGLGGESLISNAPDLIRFMQTLFFENTLLTSASRQKMLSLVATQDGGYGLGIRHIMTRWGEVWGQSSNTTGFSSAILYLPIHDLVLVTWANSKNDKDNQPLELADQSLSIVLGNSAQRFNRTVAQLGRREGRFRWSK